MVGVRNTPSPSDGTPCADSRSIFQVISQKVLENALGIVIY